MDRVCIPLIFVMLFLFLLMASSEEEEVKHALVDFMGKLSPASREPNFGWNVTSDPCTDKWKGVSCDSQLRSVRRIVLDKFNLTGVLDADSLCKTKSLFVLSLKDNSVGGEIQKELSNCRYLTHLFLSGNRFLGNLPTSLSGLGNLKRIDLSNNDLSGKLPDLLRVSGLLSFLAQNNQLSGQIPNFDFSNLLQFNVSNNNFTGPIPDVNGRFNESSFSGNPGLCGQPLPNVCLEPPPAKKESKSSSKNKALIYSGYGILGFGILLLVALKLLKKQKPKKKLEVGNSSDKISDTSSEPKTRRYRSEYSITSVESGKNSSSLVVLSHPLVKGLKFDDLLRAPAELVGRSKHGTVYKVTLNGGVTLAVKRIKDWGMPRADFAKRMQRIGRVKHPNVLPIVAYYCSKQEKLLAYAFQQNGSLFKLLHDSQNGQLFDWGSRINVAASIAQALAFMHEALRDDGIAHGNLKSSNILLNKDMDPCISEYGLMVVDACQDQSLLSQTDSFKSNADPSGGHAYSTFKVDIYSFGVILLELLTGNFVQNVGFDLARWVQSVVREEWTVEVFDKALVSEGANEERMVNLLQVALKCTNPAPDARPSIDQVATMVNLIKEEEERSLCSDP
ncbi:probable inactive receptor kinase At2g26730 [Actinidia eriantha]|uniref:probable inactive receptor kinase At2g26730 n=1 Tax=Actinidia eriantha TaxID=165200 RepID=UPI0025883808|nr:probable inactive receptor kinase At2g26730 [Actinidia eriantha]